MPAEEEISDLAKHPNLDCNEKICQQLERRFKNKDIYTYIGDVLIAVNPYEEIPGLYSTEKQEYYKNAPRDPPHIFWTAEQSYRRCRQEQGNQCIIVTGDSGAGKTESTKRIIEYLVFRSQCLVHNIEDKIKHVNPLLELFGNASTTLNNNSSRFGKFIELSYNTEGQLVGGQLRTFVLEKSRIVHHRADEKNFHIFYAFFAGLFNQDLEKYHLGRPNEYRIMLGDEQPHLHRSIFHDQEEKQEYYQRYTEGLKICREIGMTEATIEHILQILAACLHFGNIQFEPIDDETDGVAILNEDCLQNALEVLGLEDENEDIASVFSEELISRPTCIGDEECRCPYNKHQAEGVRDSVVKALYSGLFKAVLDEINRSIQGPSERYRSFSIGILDISGFESLEDNSLEQLFINITNEQIQKFHQKQIFETENREYKHEGIDLEANVFKDNTPVLDLIFKSPGVLSILDDQSKVTNAKAPSMVALYNKYLSDQEDVYKPSRDRTAFCINHYAGQVMYNATEFIVKNTGGVPEGLKELFIECKNPLVSNYFDPHEEFTCKRTSNRRTLSKTQAKMLSERYRKTKTHGDNSVKPKQINTAASQFSNSLTRLVDEIEVAKPLFVRCIKSNSNQQRRYFDEKVVMNQQISAGLLDVARIRKDGFQSRLSFMKFFEMTQIFQECQIVPRNTNPNQMIVGIMKECNVSNELYRIGQTKKKLEQEAEARKQAEIIKLQEAQKQEFIEPDVVVGPKKVSISIENADTSSNRSDPPPYGDVEDQDWRQEQKKRAYDAFRNTEIQDEGCVGFETNFLKFCRFLMYFGLTVGILSNGIATILIPLLLASKLNDDEVPKAKSSAITQLVMCFSIPNALTFLQSVLKVCLGRVKDIVWKYFIPVLILEGMEVCSMSYLFLKIVPNLPTTSGITLAMMTLTIPSFLNILKQISLAKNRHKFLIRFVFVCKAVLAFVVQFGTLICLNVYPDIVIGKAIDKTNMPDMYMLVLCLVGVSLGFCQNFMYCNVKVKNIDVKNWRISVDKARPKINLIMAPCKVLIFVLMAYFIGPDTSWDLPYTGAMQFVEDHSLMCLYVYSTIFLSYEGVLACKLLMQKMAFFVPLIMVPIGSFGMVIGLCQMSSNRDILGGKLICPNLDDQSISGWIGCSIGLLFSFILLAFHILIPQYNRMEKEQRLFILPTRDNFFSAIGLLFKRKDDTVEEELQKHGKYRNRKRSQSNDTQSDCETNNNRSSKQKKTRPYIFICGTMWHETRQEMLQLLKSLFRLDFHRSKCKIAEKHYNATVDYFEQEIHIIFDDAFETDKKSRQRLPNEWVQQLVQCIDEAASCVAKGHLDHWDNKPVKTSTPYGGRLTWVMPGGTEMTFHLKDKDKIRHRKRWSQIMYMYYLLGYKLLGTSLEETLLDKETKKRHHYRRNTSLLNHLPKDKIKKAHNSFILALDGDVDFRPEAVQKLIDKMTKNDKVGAVCGRIHPIGSGPVVWYQQFEYAVGHWLQKATEHVFGCVLCCPGAFSLFRAAAVIDDNVLKMYTSPPLEARHFIQYEQGEDRWLCTLILKAGWKIDYAASADAFTFAPDKFKDFYIQRRRWSPSTLANIIDLLSSWRTTTKANDNISTLFILYQFVLLTSSLLGIGTVTLMITGSFNAVLKTTMFQSYVIAVAPVVLYAIICVKCNNDRQIAAAAMLSTIYTLVMVIVTVGLFVNLAAEKVYSPNVIFFVEVLLIFLCSGVAHPKEIFCLVHGLLYYLMVPSTFIFLTVYYMCNIHNVSWGTREKKTDDEEPETTQAASQRPQQDPILLRCFRRIGLMALVREVSILVRQLLGQSVEQEVLDANENNNEPVMGIPAVPRQIQSRPHPRVIQDPDAWQGMEYLGNKEKTIIPVEEKDFWREILHKYLHPIIEDKKKKEEIKEELKELRNNVAFGFLLLNFLFATAIFQLQHNEDQLKDMYIFNEYEPISVAFLLVFAVVLFVQFIGMLVHRWGTFLHLVSSIRLMTFSKSKEEECVKMALKEAANLQSANRDADTDETMSLATSESTAINMDDDVFPDYPDEDYVHDNEGENNNSNRKINEYERNFTRRFKSLRRHWPHHQDDEIYNHTDQIRHRLYERTFGRAAGSRLNPSYQP